MHSLITFTVGGVTHSYIWDFSTDKPPKASELYDRVSVLDRGLAPDEGSGPVFIGHYMPDSGSELPTSRGNVDIGAISGLNDIRVNTAGSEDIFFTWFTTWEQDSPHFGYCYCIQNNATGKVKQCVCGRSKWTIPFMTANMPLGQIPTIGTGSYWTPVPPDKRYDPVRCIYWYIENVTKYSRTTSALYDATFEKDHGSETFARPVDIPFRYSEYGYWLGVAHGIPGNSGHLHPGLFSAAYYDAQEKLPQILSNTVQNIIELAQTIISFANGIDIGDLRNLKELTGHAWLAYRYQYNTTISDLEELESQLERFDDMSRALGNVTSYGKASDDTGNYFCALVVDPQEILSRSFSKRFNLRLTLANAWDMIPYSFIVDWFTNIGEVLRAIDRWLDAPSFGSVRCWYSYTNTYNTDEGLLTCYFRYSGGRPLLPYWSMDLNRSGKVWGWRATDVVSLIL